MCICDRVLLQRLQQHVHDNPDNDFTNGCVHIVAWSPKRTHVKEHHRLSCQVCVPFLFTPDPLSWLLELRDWLGLNVRSQKDNYGNIKWHVVHKIHVQAEPMNVKARQWRLGVVNKSVHGSGTMGECVTIKVHVVVLNKVSNRVCVESVHPPFSWRSSLLTPPNANEKISGCNSQGVVTSPTSTYVPCDEMCKVLEWLFPTHLATPSIAWETPCLPAPLEFAIGFWTLVKQLVPWRTVRGGASEGMLCDKQKIETYMCKVVRQIGQDVLQSDEVVKHLQCEATRYKCSALVCGIVSTMMTLPDGGVSDQCSMNDMWKLCFERDLERLVDARVDAVVQMLEQNFKAISTHPRPLVPLNTFWNPQKVPTVGIMLVDDSSNHPSVSRMVVFDEIKHVNKNLPPLGIDAKIWLRSKYYECLEFTHQTLGDASPILTGLSQRWSTDEHLRLSTHVCRVWLDKCKTFKLSQ
jgi:hypothetical protein